MLLEHAGLCGFREAVRVAVEAAFRAMLQRLERYPMPPSTMPRMMTIAVSGTNR